MTNENSVTSIAWSFWQGLSEGRIDEAIELLDESGTYWVAGSGPRQDRSMRSMKKLYRNVFEKYPLEMRLVDALESGDRVALEVESYMQLPTGLYNNRYVFITTVRDGKIVEVHEYVDTKHVDEVLVPAFQV